MSGSLLIGFGCGGEIEEPCTPPLQPRQDLSLIYKYRQIKVREPWPCHTRCPIITVVVTYFQRFWLNALWFKWLTYRAFNTCNIITQYQKLFKPFYMCCHMCLFLIWHARISAQPFELLKHLSTLRRYRLFGSECTKRGSHALSSGHVWVNVDCNGVV